jgi:hypothetical protein
MRKTSIIIIALVSIVIMSFAFKKPDEPKYENLKVLPKNTTKQQMDSIMRHFSAALGVRCNFCHVRNNDAQNNFNFASDENKHKGESREMYRMMNRINKKYFKGEKGVSCYSCHNGKENPAFLPPPPPPRTQQQSPPPQPAPPTQ